MKHARTVRLPNPSLQLDFSAFLAAARKAFLIDSLLAVAGTLETRDLDRQLADHVPQRYMRALASIGLRAELVFPVPLVLTANPRLLSYYRLLLGHSQKSFYDMRNGTGPYKCMEDRGVLPKDARLDDLCRELTRGLCSLVDGIGLKRMSMALLDDLTLLTLGPQLRGGANVRRGTASIQAVFELIRAIVQTSVKHATSKLFVLRNAAGRRVLIQFSSDPDIVVREVIGKGTIRNAVAVEVKGGTDFSNIHNRMGEAEKSHQKARANGFTECWTIVNVHRLDMEMARHESPSTDRFYRLSEILQSDTAEFSDFRNRVVAATGIREPR